MKLNERGNVNVVKTSGNLSIDQLNLNPSDVDPQVRLKLVNSVFSYTVDNLLNENQE